MAYTYQLRFSTGAYAELLPSNQIELEGLWEAGTMIWREKIGEVKIGRLKNATIYDALESWFDDDTKFATRINIKILLDGVEESVHWFGVKWGTINEFQKTYTVTPVLYDLWGQYFESTKDVISTDKIGPLNNDPRYYGATGTYEAVNQNFANEAYFEQITKDLSSFASGFSTGNVVSSFVWQSDYEDTSSVGTYQGMPLDYVTGKGSPLTFGGLKFKSSKYLDGRSFVDMLQWYSSLRVFVFFDSNDKLRFEHIKFFNDKLTDNAVDYTSLMKPSDEKYSYVDPQIAVKENLSLRREEDDVDEDFVSSDIIYSDITNRPDTQMMEYGYDLYSNLGFYSTALITDELILFGAFENQVHTWFDIDMISFDSDGNAFDIVWNTLGGNDFCGSNDIWVFSAGRVYDFTAEITSITGTFQAYLKDRGGATISNKMTVNATGTSTGIITSTAPAQDGYLTIEGTVGSEGQAEGWISLSGGTYPMIPTIDGFTSGSPKTNGGMSVANIIDQWWRDDRLSRTAIFNSTGYAATSTIFNLARDTINVYPAAIPNPLFGWNDGVRIGKIDKWKRNLKTGYYQIDLIYQEDD